MAGCGAGVNGWLLAGPWRWREWRASHRTMVTARMGELICATVGVI